MPNHDDTNVTNQCLLLRVRLHAQHTVSRGLAPLSTLHDGGMGDNAIAVVIVSARFRIFRALDIKHNR
jgi:hypothetical protein